MLLHALVGIPLELNRVTTRKFFVFHLSTCFSKRKIVTEFVLKNLWHSIWMGSIRRATRFRLRLQPKNEEKKQNYNNFKIRKLS